MEVRVVAFVPIFFVPIPHHKGHIVERLKNIEFIHEKWAQPSQREKEALAERIECQTVQFHESLNRKKNKKQKT